MAIEVTLPKLGLTMEEGTLEEWLVNDGDVITVGTPLLRLATDKIDVDVEAEAEGIIARAVPNGTTLPPGAVLGWLLAPGEVAPAGAAPVAAAAVVHEGGRQFVSPNARRVADQLGVD
ncbi:MAG: biotin/lipoyl-containing protein, partial [Candidatus Nanopelagicales bacterium]